jgi:hypothetical protein
MDMDKSTKSFDEWHIFREALRTIAHENERGHNNFAERLEGRGLEGGGGLVLYRVMPPRTVRTLKIPGRTLHILTPRWLEA